MVVVVLDFWVGFPGGPGGSATSVTLMVMAMVSSMVVSALWSGSRPSWTLAVTLYVYGVAGSVPSGFS